MLALPYDFCFLEVSLSMILELIISKIVIIEVVIISASEVRDLVLVFNM
jgi:hypothetical protein